MKPLSILAAVIVGLVLYAVVFERDRLVQFAGAGNESTPEAAAAPAQESADAPGETDAPHVVSVVVIDSTARVFDSAVVLRGQTAAARQVDVRSEVGGLVISPPLRKGHFAQAGEVLCKIDPGTRPVRVAEAEAALAEAKINYKAASQLAQGGFASETRAVGASAQLQAAEAAVAAANKEIERLTITAPFSGTLESDTAELGSLMQAGSLCATIIQLDPIKVVGYVPETRIEDIKPGASAQAVLATGRQVLGEVTFISRSADPQTRTFMIEISADNTDLAIRDGQSADITIDADGVPAHEVPASALTLDDSGQMGLRLVDENDTVVFAPVRLLRDTPDGMIVTGLPQKARIIVVGQEFVSQGVKVRPVLRENAS